MEYLDFELPIKDIVEQLDKCKIIGNESEIDVTDTCDQLEKKLIETKKEIYENLTAWQRVQMSRHPSRPYTLDYIKGICKNSQKAFVITAVICSIIGILVGSFQVDFIIILAVPALMFLYPITIVLILLNVIPDKFGSKIVFRAVVFTTFLFSIPDFLGFIIDEKYQGTKFSKKFN